MLGRALSVLAVMSFFCQSAFAVHSIHLPYKNQKIAWENIKCTARGAGLVIESVGADTNGQDSSLRIDLKDFRSVNKNSDRTDLVFEMDGPSVGSITFVDPKGKKWGDLNVPGLHTKCNLTLVREKTDFHHISLYGYCRELGDIVRGEGPRTAIDFSKDEVISCTL